VFPGRLFSPAPLVPKNNTDPHIFVQVNIEWPDDREPKLKFYIPHLILDRYKYIPVAYVTMHCTI
jgi:hypothetical protein